MRHLMARCAVVLALVLGSAWQARGANPRPAWYPPDEVVGKQLALREQKRKAAEAYYQRVIQGQYDSVGSHSPEWDDAARRFIAANISQRVNLNSAPPDAQMLRMLAANDCARLKCTDPFIRYLLARTGVMADASGDKAARAIPEGCEALLASRYQGMLRFYAHIYLAAAVGAQQTRKADADLAQAERSLDAALQMLPEVLAEPDLPDCEIQGLLGGAQEASSMIYGDRWQWAEKVYAVMEQKLPTRSAVYAAKGSLFANYAWDARGNGVANSVTEEGWRLMRERLSTAEEACLLAWGIDHQCLEATVTMLMVELGQHRGMDVLDRWFGRAVAIDPHYYPAYSQKLLYLASKWYGSDEKAMTFAREVASTLPAKCDVRLVVADAHLDLASRLARAQDSMGMTAEAAYFRDHPEAYREMAGVYEDLITLGSATATERMVFARLSVAAGDGTAAGEALNGIPDEQTEYFFGDRLPTIREAINR